MMPENSEGTLSVQQKNTTMTFNKLIDTLNAQNLAFSREDYVRGIRYPGRTGGRINSGSG